MADWQKQVQGLPVQEVTIDGRRFSYRQAGNGPDLVLLHGIGSGSGSWASQLVAFSEGYRVTAWDAPGYGSSDCLATSTPSADDYAQALEVMLDELNVSQASIVGHSLGALMAGAFAVRCADKVKGLVLASPALGYGMADEGIQAKKLASRANMMNDLGPKGMARERAGNLLSAQASEEQISQVKWNMAQVRPDGYCAAAWMLTHGDLPSDAARTTQSIHVICGADDSITTAAASKEFAAGLKTAGYHEIFSAGHAVYIEQPAAFNDVLADLMGMMA